MEELTFKDIIKSEARSREIVKEICRKERISTEIQREPESSRIVFYTGDGLLVKVFAPEDIEFQKTESVFLQTLSGRLPVETPNLIAQGQSGGFPYIAMKKLPGVTMKKIWPGLSASERRGLIGRVGNLAGELNNLPVELFPDLPFQWEPFIRNQISRIEESHAVFGLNPALAAQIPDYLEASEIDFFENRSISPLHTELMKEHLLIAERNGGLEVTGLIDFEPSMVGHREYELCSVGIFITGGDRELFKIFLDSSGHPLTGNQEELSFRIMTFLLLHRYSNLTWFMSLFPELGEVTRLTTLERFWYSS